MKSSEIRETFLRFFESKEHKRLPGSSLVPADPTVLLTLAGMLQFKPIFLGQEKPVFRRVTTVQKCIRTIDIDRVGKTKRHHTFFEMLGNFSFGDYFKKEAIQFAWELLTKEFKLPVTKLKIAIYEKDEEAFDYWHKNIGLPPEIIYKLTEENNFWAAGPTGPCGPCSEIYYDFGQDHGCGRPDCQPGCDCDRYLEVWNLVFIQYNRNEQGELIPLKQKGIDTGMGLERIAAILQGVDDNFETDLFVPLLKKITALTTVSNPAKESIKIVADHIRAITQLISDGVYPENVGRGYVLRRLIRRAVRHGKLIGIDKPFLVTLADEVIASLGDVYPLLREKSDGIRGIIHEEETAFFSLLAQGIRWFEDLLTLHQQDKKISGDEAFKLHDTYGFPIELTSELAAEKGFLVDLTGFNAEMEKQKNRARQAGLESDKKRELIDLDLSAIGPTNFTGYEKTSEETKVVAVYPNKNAVILEKTPFYGESGGQVGDTGLLSWDNQEVRVTNTFISPKGTIIHLVEDVKNLKKETKIKALIDCSKRQATEAHHTATHLLHQALREVLGDQVKQSGSYVGPDKLRFDFNHFHQLTCEELQKIEQLVNQKIKEKIKVEVLHKSYQEAVKMGAKALFGEKYGDKVRVLKIDSYSLELCGGTHVNSTEELLFFKIISESALGTGLRRIEALAGQAAKVYIVYHTKALYDEVKIMIKHYRQLQLEKEKYGGTKSLETNIFEIDVTEMTSVAAAVDNQDSVNVNKFLDHLQGRVDWLKERIAKAEKEVENLKIKQLAQQATDYLAEVKEIKGKKVLMKEFRSYNPEMLRSISDTLQSHLKSCLLLLATSDGSKVNFLLTITPDLVAAGLSAKALAGKFAETIEGRCGGRENKAEGGGKLPDKIGAGFAAVEQLL